MRRVLNVEAGVAFAVETGDQETGAVVDVVKQLHLGKRVPCGFRNVEAGLFVLYEFGALGRRDFQDVITALASYGCRDGACRRFVLDAWDRNGVCDAGTGEGAGKVEFAVEVDGCCRGTRRLPVRKDANCLLYTSDAADE